MTSLGYNGRFGNQIFQYAYLRLYAASRDAKVETPDWMGRDIFGLDDPLPSKQLPHLFENQFDFSSRPTHPSDHPANVDLWGYFQFPTSEYLPFRQAFCDLFRPKGKAGKSVEQAWENLGAGSRHLVTLHLRRSDFGYGQFWLAPTAWYASWLDENWSRFDRPVLYVASDDPDAAEEFSRYSPKTAASICDLPPDLHFIIDFFLMARAHALAIANSSFSFAASMLNAGPLTTVRPNPVAERLVDFDPWNAKPLLGPPWSDPPPSPLDALIVQQFIAPHSVVFDFGAERGAWSRLVQQTTLGRAKLFACETKF